MTEAAPLVASEVYVSLPAPAEPTNAAFVKAAEKLLVEDVNGYWTGFFARVTDGTPYRFFVVGDAGGGYKRDPYARELGDGYPECNCIVRDPKRFAWHDQSFRPPAFNDLIVSRQSKGRAQS